MPSLQQQSDQLFGVGALAHRGPSPIGGLCGKCHPLSPHRTNLPREGCPGYCDTLFYGTDFQQLGVTFFMPKHLRLSVRLLWYRRRLG